MVMFTLGYLLAISHNDHRHPFQSILTMATLLEVNNIFFGLRST